MFGVGLWLLVLASGIHPTIAGVLLALTVPAGTMEVESELLAPAPLQRMEQALQRPVAFVVLPLFALANAGVTLRGGVSAVLHSPVAFGVGLGLLVGKPLGITLASYAAVRTGAAELPTGVAWRHVHGAAWLGGIGFTMSLFIAGLAFTDPAKLDTAKLGVLGASVCAGMVGYTLLRGATRRAVTSEIERPA
jgi:NhaA family Na+:H+ antiporter